MDKYLDCLFDNELSVLVIEGTPPEDQLKDAWNKIYVESCQLSQNSSYNEVFELSKAIDELRAKIYIVDGIVSHLQLAYSVELVSILNSLGLNCDLKAEHIGRTLIQKLNAVVGRSKKWWLMLEQKQKLLDKTREKNTDKMDRNDFEDQLLELGKFLGYHVKASEITVTQFYRGLNRMKERNDIEMVKNLKGNGYRKGR